MLQDLRFGAHAPQESSFAAVAILTLALGIGINAAIFSIVDGVLLRPLPYPNADRLVRIWSANRETGQRYLETSYQDFQQFAEQSRAFAGMAAFSEAPRILRDGRLEPIHITVARISQDFFSVLGISPTVGRDFLAEEHEGSARSVVLSERLWRTRYAADPGILGRSVMIDDEPHTVVGVMPQGAGFPKTADLWRPLTERERHDDDPELLIIARLAPGVSMDRADVEVGTIARRISRASAGVDGESLRTAWVQTMQAMVVREVRMPLLVLLGAVGLVLLIACANVANLLLARGLARAADRDPRGHGRGATATGAPAVDRERLDRLPRWRLGAVVGRLGAKGHRALRPGSGAAIERSRVERTGHHRHDPGDRRGRDRIWADPRVSRRPARPEHGAQERRSRHER
jgi:predicted permease